jgi:hypothetical protein
MRFKDYITEVFDTEVNITKIKKSKNEWTAWFEIDGKEFEFIAYSEIPDRWLINFYDSSGETEITGKGDQFKVYSSVIQIIKKFIKDVKPKVFVFPAKERSRIKLYDKLSQMIAKQSPYKLLNRERDEEGDMIYVFGK